jgi:HlyD family secretion protein
MRNSYIYLSFFIVLISCKKEKESVKVVQESISESVYGSAIILSKNQYEVYAPNTGILQKILINEGDIVKRGQSIFIIQNETSRLQAENAKIGFDFAEWNRQGEKLKELEGQIELSKNKMKNDSLIYERQKKIWDQNIGAAIDLEKKELSYESSKNEYKVAQYRYNDLKKQLSFLSLQSKKLLSISKSQLSDYIIKSKVNGKVSYSKSSYQ